MTFQVYRHGLFYLELSEDAGDVEPVEGALRRDGRGRSLRPGDLDRGVVPLPGRFDLGLGLGLLGVVREGAGLRVREAEVAVEVDEDQSGKNHSP